MEERTGAAPEEIQEGDIPIEEFTLEEMAEDEVPEELTSPVDRTDEPPEPGPEPPEEETEPPVSVTYETNGNVNPHRVIVRLAGESDVEEGFAINISRSGKATVGDDEEEGQNVRRRRR